MSNIEKYQPAQSTKPFFGGLLNEFFNHNLSNFIGSDSVLHQPGVNVIETPDAFRLEVAAPGFDKQDFSVNLEDKQLVVSANREKSVEDQNERFVRREFHYVSFKRSFHLPETVNPQGIAAVYNNGVLQVTLPKKEEAKPLVKTVEIG